LLSACAPRPETLEEIKTRGTLRVVTLNAPTSYYLGTRGAEGLEYRLAERFAGQLGVSLDMKPLSGTRALLRALKSGRADIAAAQLTADPAWSRLATAAAPYQRIPQLVVTRSGKGKPAALRELAHKRVAVRLDSPQAHMLQALNLKLTQKIDVVSLPPGADDPLQTVMDKHADAALIDEREFSFSRHLYPDITVAFALDEPRAVQWLVRAESPQVVAAVNAFFDSIKQSGELTALLKESSGDVREFYYEESREFQQHVASRLATMRPWFESAGISTGVDWRMLAAIGYQESKWDASAQSGDGALGVMMLTSTTAQELGVNDRMDPEQNIRGGAKYFISVREKIPARIPEPDRTWLALAAYNVGYGHLEDARVLTQTRGKNPDSWNDVKASLPLLGQERWYLSAKRGYARGWEPVQFVERVQRFIRLLEWQAQDPGKEVLDPRGSANDQAGHERQLTRKLDGELRRNYQ
jgi:membrane-bound lytic murein transglycosylase F